jgi:hypothetical protein
MQASNAIVQRRVTELRLLRLVSPLTRQNIQLCVDHAVPWFLTPPLRLATLADRYDR